MRWVLLLLAVVAAGCGSTYAAKGSVMFSAEPGMVAEDAPAPETARRAAWDADGRAKSELLTALTASYGDTARPVGTPEERAGQERLLIYSGQFSVAVGNIEDAQEAARAMAEGLGGYFQSLKADTITLRVPAKRWEEAVAGVRKIGRVLDRAIDAADVTEEVVDLQLRLRNAQKLMKRFEELLEKAETVEAALKVEKELARVRVEVERLEGRLNFLADRIAFSTLTIRFVKAAEASVRPQALPFPWLTELSLESLLGLEGGAR
jgi:hypothetical protein